jgi:hypothetical protein
MSSLKCAERRDSTDTALQRNLEFRTSAKRKLPGREATAIPQLFLGPVAARQWDLQNKAALCL